MAPSARRTRFPRVPRRFAVGQLAGLIALAAVLALGAVSSQAEPPPPSITAGVHFRWVSLNNWTPGSTVEVVIAGVTRSVAVDAGGNAWISTQNDVVPGLIITATHGLTTKTLQVANLRINSLNSGTDTVAGVAPPNATFNVGIHRGPDRLADAEVTADAGGNWAHSFAPFDIALGMTAVATVGDDDGDTTYAEKKTPVVWAGIDNDWVMLNDWTPGTPVTLDIGGIVRNAAIDSSGNASISRQTHGRDIVPGMAISATDGIVTKALTVAGVHIDSVDLATDAVAGTAPPGSQVRLGVNPLGSGQPLGFADATAGGTGHWTASFAGGVDLTFGLQVWAAVADPDGDTSSADKNLQQPTITGSLTYDNVNANGFTANASVTFTIRPAPGEPPLASGSKPTDAMGNSWFNRYQDHSVDLVSGMQITATDGSTTKWLTLAPLRIVSVNSATDVVSGTAPENKAVQVNVNNPPSGGGMGMQVTADAGGSWSAHFSGTFDITGGTSANAFVRDDDGDQTSVDKPPATINASLTNDMIDANGFTAGGTVSFTIRAAPGEEPPLATGSKLVDPSGHASFNRRAGDHDVDLAPGMEITADDGTSAKQLILADLAISLVDPATNVVSGRAPPNANVQVGVNDSAGGSGTQVTADPLGNWSADFTGRFDITPRTGANALVSDDDGDQTGAGKQPSSIFASLTSDNVGANGFAAGADVDFTIRNLVGTVLDSGTKQADAMGNAFFNRWEDHELDLVPGLEVTVSDGTTTKELTLAELVVVYVNPTTDVVSGTAGGGAKVDVHVQDGMGFADVQVTAGPGGLWSAEFAGTYDIGFITDADVRVSDEDGDSTGFDKSPPRIAASLTGDGIEANWFAPGADVDFTIRRTDGTVLDSGTKQADVAGNASFNPGEDHSVDLVPGMRVSAADGTFTKEVVLVELAITSVDPDSDLVSGTAPSGVEVEVGFWDYWETQRLTADTNDEWSASFSGLFDVTYQSGAFASVRDSDGDSTGVEASPARIEASLTWDNIFVQGLAPRQTVDYTIEAEGGEVLASGSSETDGQGNVWLERWDGHGVDLEPGMEITVDDGANVKELTLAELAIVSIDIETDVVSGTAEGAADVQVNVNDPDGAGSGMQVTAEDGNWSADFAGLFDITFATAADVSVSDEDGDTTGFSKPPPRIDASLTWDSISVEGFAPAEDVTLTIETPGGPVVRNKQTDGAGNAWFNRWEDFDEDLVPGTQITVADARGNTKDLTLAALSIGSVDPADDIVAGTAPGGANVEVEVGSESGEAYRETTADAQGAWSMDFSPFEVTFATWADARVRDADGDATAATRQPPIISGDLTFDGISAEWFAPGATVSLTIRQSAGGAVLDTASKQTDDRGSAWFDRHDHDVNLAVGMHILVTDGTVTKELTLAVLTIDEVDAEADTISGTAPPNTTVQVPGPQGELASPTSDQYGAWSADLTGIFDITPGTEMRANVYDEEWDWTTAAREAATIAANLTLDTVSGCGFAPEGSVTVTVGDFSGPFGMGAAGCFEIGPGDHGKDLVAGMSVSVTDGMITRELTLATLTMDVDVTSGRVMGTAAPGTDVEVGYSLVDEERGDGMTVTADAEGRWSADFGHFESPNVEVDASVHDPDGDRTAISWRAWLYFATETYTVPEGAGTVEVTVERYGMSHSEVGVSYATSDGTATAGSDFTATSGTLAFPDRVATRTFTVAILDDSSHEPDETVNLTLSDPTGGAVLAMRPTATIRIVDDDGADTDPPETTIDSGPSGPTNDSTPTFTFSADEPGSTFECRVDSEPFAPCTSPHTTGALGDGAHSFDVRARDAAGNVDTTPARRNFTVDTVAPETTIDSGPSGLMNDSTPTFTFSSEPGASFQCRVDSAAFAVCSSPHTTAALADGAHAFEVRAVDLAGNTDGSPPNRAFAVDTTPPETTIDSGLSGLTGDPKPTFGFSSEPGASFQCRVDSAAFAVCSSPYTTAALADGAHSFEVRATDAAGNVDGSPASRAFTVDTGPPDTTIDSGPSGSTTDPTPTFAFSANETGASFQCRLDSAAFTACSSPHTTPTLALGSHTLEVRSIDAVGNVDATPASRAFTVAAPVVRTTVGLVSKTVTVTKGRVAAIRLRCGAGAACRGTITLQATVDARLLGSTAKRRTIVLGKRSFSIAAGRTATVNVRLTPQAYRLLVRVRRLRGQARISYRQATGTTTVIRAITLKAPSRPIRR